MEMINACLCCMVRPPEKDLSTPYPRAGSTEVYSDMMEYCFQIQLTVSGEAGGICEECVEQLRDARDFRLQVECSQARLLAQGRPWPALGGGFVDRYLDESAGFPPETCPDEASEESAIYWTETCPAEASAESASCLPKLCPVEVNDKSQFQSHEPPIVIEIDSDSEDESYVETSRVAPPVKMEAETDSGDEPEELLPPASPVSDGEGPASPASQRSASASPASDGSAPGSPASDGSAPRSPASEGSAPGSPSSDGAGHVSARARRQLAMSCCVRLERLRSLERPETPLADPPASPDSATTEPCAQTARNANCSVQQTDRTYDCYFCKKRFTEISDLVAHLEKHTGQEPYSCRICYKMFPIKSHLMLHSKIHKEGHYDRLQTDKHIINIIDRVKPIDKSFERRSHKTVRSDGKPYRCEVCNKLFTLSSSLLKHMRSHMSVKPKNKLNKFSGKRTHSKSEDFKYFNTKFVLHDSTAAATLKITSNNFKTSYYCRECKMKFKTESKFIEHKRTHTGVSKS